jgi:hypothetical protein
MDTKFTDDTVTVCVFPQDLAFYFDTSFCKTKVDVSNFETSIQKKNVNRCLWNEYIHRQKQRRNQLRIAACLQPAACMSCCSPRKNQFPPKVNASRCHSCWIRGRFIPWFHASIDVYEWKVRFALMWLELIHNAKWLVYILIICTYSQVFVHAKVPSGCFFFVESFWITGYLYTCR